MKLTRLAIAATLALLPAPVHAQGYSFQSLASFNGYNGNMPYSNLTPDGQGNFYGTTFYGGNNNSGVLFRYTLATGELTTRVNFHGTNGANPRDGVTIGSDGSLYGTTEYGGSNGDGTVFEFSPSTVTFTMLHAFSGADGTHPYGNLVADGSGHLYGVTNAGGRDAEGTLYKITLSTGLLTTLVNFQGPGGAFPAAGLTIDSNGNFYGTTSGGGTGHDGTVFKFVPATGALTTLVNFSGSNGKKPVGPVSLGSGGVLFGTTVYGGTNNNGTLYQFNPSSGVLTTLHNFASGSDGANPSGSLAVDSKNDVFGTAQQISAPSNPAGSVYEYISSSATFTPLYDFFHSNGITSPVGGLITDGSGVLFGTASDAPGGYGALFELIPAP